MATHQTDPRPLSGVRARALPRPQSCHCPVLFDSVKLEAREAFAKTAWCEGKMSSGISGHPQNQELRSSPKKENNRQREEILRGKIVIKK